MTKTGNQEDDWGTPLNHDDVARVLGAYGVPPGELRSFAGAYFRNGAAAFDMLVGFDILPRNCDVRTMLSEAICAGVELTESGERRAMEWGLFSGGAQTTHNEATADRRDAVPVEAEGAALPSTLLRFDKSFPQPSGWDEVAFKEADDDPGSVMVRMGNVRRWRNMTAAELGFCGKKGKPLAYWQTFMESIGSPITVERFPRAQIQYDHARDDKVTRKHVSEINRILFNAFGIDNAFKTSVVNRETLYAGTWLSRFYVIPAE